MLVKSLNLLFGNNELRFGQPGISENEEVSCGVSCMRLLFCLTAIVYCSMQEDGPLSCASVRLNGRKPSSDEEVFLQRLYDYMEEKKTPIGRIPTLGFQKGN